MATAEVDGALGFGRAHGEYHRLPSDDEDCAADEHDRLAADGDSPLFSSASVDENPDEERLVELAVVRDASGRKKKRVSWVDIERGKDSVVFGAVTQVYAADSKWHYDRRPAQELLEEPTRAKVLTTLVLGLVLLGVLVVVIIFFGWVGNGAIEKHSEQR